MQVLKLKIFILSFVFLIHQKNEAQNNLIPNGSFEVNDTCPLSAGFLHLATPWFNPNTVNYGTPDVFNTCCISCMVSVPSNAFGSQFPKTGNGYAGIACVIDTINVREYIEVPLDSALIAGQKYCVEFYVSLADACSLATSNIGAYFSIDSLLDSTQGNAIEYVIPQITNSSTMILSNKLNWMKIFGVFTAQGGEKFMTIGNFLSPANTVVQNVGGSYSYAYYYIDDVSVTACDTTLTSVDENENNYNFNLYPNPSTGNFAVKYDLKQGNDDAVFKLYDVRGKLLHETVLNKEITSFDFSDVLANGVYFYKLTINDNIVMSDKLIIIK